MEISFNKSGENQGRLTVNVVKADYEPEVEKTLKEVGKRNQIPGFRKGHVPMGELRRRFGRQAKSDAINDVVYKAVEAYINDNKLDVLGSPMPVEVKEIDLNGQDDFTFEYDLMIAPEVKVELNKDIHVPYYTITVSDDMVNEELGNLRKRFGTQEPGEEFEDDAIVKGALMQLNEDGTINDNEGAIQQINGIVAPFYFKDKAEADKFKGAKVGSKVVFNPWKSCEGNAAELSSMLGVDKEIAPDVKNDFELAVSEIIVVRLAELDQKFFDTAFGPDRVHNEEECREAIKQGIAASLTGNSRMLFRRDAQKVLLDKYAPEMTFPDELLKRWLMTRESELNEENINERYTEMLPALKWQILTDRIAQACEIKLEEADVLNFAKATAAQQFAQYGMANLADEIIENYAKHMLEDKNMHRRIVEQAGDAKLFQAIHDAVSLDNHDVTLDEFKKVVEENA